MENKPENKAKVKLEKYMAKWKVENGKEHSKEDWEKGIIVIYEELKEKAENKTITKEEYKKYKKYAKIKANFPKIDNLWKYLEELIQFRNLIGTEIESRNQFRQQEARLAVIDRNMQNIKLRIKETQEEIKNAEGKTKTLLMENLEKYKSSLSKNQDEYSKVFLANRAQKESKTELSNMPTEQLEELAKKTDIQNSKTRMYISKLKEGMDINDITAIVDKTEFSHLKANKSNAEKMRELKESQRYNKERGTRKSVKEHIAQTVQGYIKEEEKEANNKEESLAKISEFDKKHPKFARIKNWFKDKYYTIKDKIDSLIYEKEEEEVKDEEQEPVKETPREKFLDQLTVADYDIAKIAEMGTQEYVKQKNRPNIINKKDAAKNLKENREALYGKSLKKSSIDDQLDKIANRDEGEERQ